MHFDRSIYLKQYGINIFFYQIHELFLLLQDLSHNKLGKDGAKDIEKILLEDKSLETLILES